MSIHFATKLTRLFDIRTPIVLAGMAKISSAKLVSEVSLAGGLGVWGAAFSVINSNFEEIRKELEEIRSLCGGRPFGIDLIAHGSGKSGVPRKLLDIFLTSGCSLFITGRGFPSREVVEEFHKKGILVGSVAGTVRLEKMFHVIFFENFKTNIVSV